MVDVIEELKFLRKFTKKKKIWGGGWGVGSGGGSGWGWMCSKGGSSWWGGGSGWGVNEELKFL